MPRRNKRLLLFDGGGFALGLTLAVAGLSEPDTHPTFGLLFTAVGLFLLVIVWLDGCFQLIGRPLREVVSVQHIDGGIQVKWHRPKLGGEKRVNPQVPRRSLAQLKREGLELHRDYMEELESRARNQPVYKGAPGSHADWQRSGRYSQETGARLLRIAGPKLPTLYRDLASYGYTDPVMDVRIDHIGHFMSAEGWLTEMVQLVAALCDRIPEA